MPPIGRHFFYLGVMVYDDDVSVPVLPHLLPVPRNAENKLRARSDSGWLSVDPYAPYDLSQTINQRIQLEQFSQSTQKGLNRLPNNHTRRYGYVERMFGSELRNFEACIA